MKNGKQIKDNRWAMMNDVKSFEWIIRKVKNNTCYLYGGQMLMETVFSIFGKGCLVKHTIVIFIASTWCSMLHIIKMSKLHQSKAHFPYRIFSVTVVTWNHEFLLDLILFCNYTALDFFLHCIKLRFDQFLWCSEAIFIIFSISIIS